MTQAYNLSQLANNLNSSGQLDATDGLVNAVPATNGGTGQAAYVVGDILYAPTTTTLNRLADVATGNALLSGGVGLAPAYGKIILTTHVSGILPVANGGTSISAPGTAGNLLTSTGSDFQSGGGAATPPGVVTFSATAMAVNCLLSNVFATTFTANVTVAPTLTNPINGQTVNWFITQDATGGRTIIWPSSFKWPNGVIPVLSVGANAVDLLVITYRSTTGFWYATLAKAFS
jgi:hypothetical protein